MQHSTVKWFDAKKGYGFIDHPKGGDDVFVHYSQIVSDNDFKTLRTGQAVEFELSDGPKGVHALDVKPTQESGGEDEASESAAVPQEGVEAVPAGDFTAEETSHEELSAEEEEGEDDEWEWGEDWTDEHGNPPDPMAGPTF